MFQNILLKIFLNKWCNETSNINKTVRYKGCNAELWQLGVVSRSVNSWINRSFINKRETAIVHVKAGTVKLFVILDSFIEFVKR